MTSIDIAYKDFVEFDDKVDVVLVELKTKDNAVKDEETAKTPQPDNAWRNHRLQTFFFKEMENSRDNSNAVFCYTSLMLILYLASIKYDCTIWLDVFFILPACVLFGYLLTKFDNVVARAIFQSGDVRPFKLEKNIGPSLLLATIFSVCSLEIILKRGPWWFLVSINLCAILTVVAHITCYQFFVDMEREKIKKLRLQWF